MKSVKGMTVCTPEFHAVAKAGEEQAKITQLIDRLQDDVAEIMRLDPITDEHTRKLARIRRDLGDLLYGTY